MLISGNMIIEPKIPGDSVLPVSSETAPTSGQEAGVLPDRSDSPPDNVRAHIPVNARGLALSILATVAFVFALQWARLFFIPLILSILISYTLAPVVTWLEKRKVPRLVGASLILLTILCGTFVAANSLRTEVQSILVHLPESVHQLSIEIINTQDGQPSTMQQMQAAATEIEQASNQAANIAPGTGKKLQTVIIARPTFQIQDWLWAGSMGAAGTLGQMAMVGFLTFFLLMSGDRFKRKLVKISGPSLSSKKVTVHILDAIDKSIQGYMFMQLVTNLALALLLWIALRWIGLENAGAWAAAAGCLRIIPYIGSVVIAVATGLSAYAQFGSMGKMFLVSGTSMLLAGLVGIFLTTWMTGRIAKMNSAAVFVSLLFWGWLWGIWGLLLGVPIIVMVRVVAEHVDGMQSIAELLGE